MLSSKRDSEPAESTPVKREDVLTVLDECGVSWFHCKTVVIAGMGFFADAYDLFSISLLTKLLGRIYYQEYKPGAKPGKLPINENAAISALALVGTLVGQLVFGFLGDRLGRKRMRHWLSASGAKV